MSKLYYHEKLAEAVCAWLDNNDAEPMVILQATITFAFYIKLQDEANTAILQPPRGPLSQSLRRVKAEVGTIHLKAVEDPAEELILLIERKPSEEEKAAVNKETAELEDNLFS